MPPNVQMRNDCQNGKFVHQPTMTSAGRTKMIEDIAPPTDATVCTVMFSHIVDVLKARSRAIEITAAGMAEANVRPTRKPR
jgi:hypothetical protein